MTAQQRRLGALLGVVLAWLPMSTGPASAGPLEDKRAEASRIRAELERQGERISVLDEQYNRARLRVEEVDTAFAATEVDLRRAEQRYRAARARLARHAVDAYMHGAPAALVERLVTSNGADLPLRQRYVEVAAGNERQAIDDFRAAQEDLSIRRRQAADGQRKARAAAEDAERDRSAVERAVAAQNAVLAKVQGELAQLVAVEQARRAQAEASRAQRELTARVAAERARARTPVARATTSTPSQRAKPRLPPPPQSAPPVGRGAAAAVAEARRQIGKPYVWAAAGPDSFDCSGLTQWAWQAGGVRLSHSTYAQWDETPRVSISALQPGDLVYFGDDLHHMAIYSGGGMMIEAPYTGTTVRERPLRTKDLAGATRPG
jgi:cell wall-associated NlpC family hydrolase